MDNNNPYAPPNAAIGDLPGGTSSTFITLYWSGRGKLWKIYWMYGTFVGWLLVPIYILAARSGIPVRAISGALLPYRVWVVVSIWRCAFNSESRTWGYVARILAVIGFSSTTYFIITGHLFYRTLFGR
jgi:hypothetical protein